jgi:hypothetical protein
MDAFIRGSGLLNLERPRSGGLARNIPCVGFTRVGSYFLGILGFPSNRTDTWEAVSQEVVLRCPRDPKIPNEPEGRIYA